MLFRGAHNFGDRPPYILIHVGSRNAYKNLSAKLYQLVCNKTRKEKEVENRLELRQQF